MKRTSTTSYIKRTLLFNQPDVTSYVILSTLLHCDTLSYKAGHVTPESVMMQPNVIKNRCLTQFKKATFMTNVYAGVL